MSEEGKKEKMSQNHKTSSINPQVTKAAQAQGSLTKEQAKAKKRSELLSRSILDLPANLDRERFKYRWISRHLVEKRSDGWDPRGWEIHKNPETGNPFTVGDLILGRMPTEDVEIKKEMLEEAAESRMRALADQHKQSDDRLSYEVRKAGGKMKTTIEYGED